MLQTQGQCDFCKESAVCFTPKGKDTKICRKCLKTANHVLVAAPKGAVICPSCKGYSLFTVTYEDNANVTYKRRSVLDAHGLIVYQIASVSLLKTSSWLPSATAAKKCICGLCNTAIPLEYLKDSEYVS